MSCEPRYRRHDGPVMPIADSYVPIDDGFAIDVRCESCGAVGEVVIDFEADVNWEDDGQLVCPECGWVPMRGGES